jgi:serine/threonine protein kinase
MGEVYRAHDRTLNRDVAVKVLPEALALDPDRLARFQREAQVLASLNHPNIAAIYGFEDSGAVQALVLELVEGPTLADRIAQGAIPLEEALPIARQIADALAAAHEHGIVHRDLKPANIKLRSDGTVKVLDFGLAKLVQPEPSSRTNLTASPTITSPAMMTGVGVLLGTAGYMSPEQARGVAVDRGADIWAFGCVLFEMLSGTRPFPGADATETIASIIRSEPEWSRLPAGMPPSVLRLLRRCLTKDRARRLADVRDARLDIEDAQIEPANRVSPGRSRLRERLAWSAACVLSALVAAAAMLWRPGGLSSGASLPEMRVEITTPPTSDEVSLAISPDGEKLVFVASSDGRPKLWLRSLGTGSARPLPGTDGASFPFWSPDSRSVAFFANGNLNRIDIDGSSLRTLASAPVGAGGTWNREGVILYTLVPDAPISRVPADGGKSAFVPGLQPGAPGHRFPQFLPDGRHFLYYVADSATRGVYAGTLDGSERRRLFDADAAAVFVPPARVLFVRAGTLFAQRFDPVRQQLEGNTVALAEGVSVDSVGAAAVSGSAAGSIVYRVGQANRQRQLLWFDRSGNQVGVAAAPDAATSLNPTLSADGRRVALNRSVNGNSDVWLLDLGRSVLSRFTFDPGPEIFPVWSPDGTRIVYAASNRTGAGFRMFQKPTAGAGQASPLLDTGQNMIPDDWSRDGRFISFATSSSGNWDVGAFPLEGNAKPFPVAQTSYDELSSEFSPDGHWIAYESNESGRNEIYVQPFPNPATKTIVSTGGGLQPHWGPDGRELFYVAPDGRLMSVPLRVASDRQAIEPGSPVPLFTTRISSTRTGGSRQEYAVSADGKRFLMNTFVEQAGAPITLVLSPASLEN